MSYLGKKPSKQKYVQSHLQHMLLQGILREKRESGQCFLVQRETPYFLEGERCLKGGKDPELSFIYLNLKL